MIYGPPQIGLGRPIDPPLDLALRAAESAIRTTGDPNIGQTFVYVRRIIVAAPPPKVPRGAPPPPGRISDINPVLRGVAWGMERRPVLYAAAIAIPVLSFLAGLALGRRR